MESNWSKVELGEIAEIISGKNQRQVENSEGKYPIYGSGGVFGFADEFLCPPGTTVIGRKGTINSPIFVNENFWNVDTAFGIHPYKYVLPKLLFYFCKGFNFKKLDKSTTIPSLAKRDLLKIEFPLIPLPEQRAIVARIEELFSELDHSVSNLQAAQAKLEIYRQAVLKKAFEREEEFQNLSVEECCTDIVDCLHSTAKFHSTGYFCIDTTSIDDTKISFKKARFVDEETYFDRIRRLKPKENDILFSREGTVGKAVIVPPNIDLCLGQRMMMFRLKKEFNTKFIQYFFLSPGFKAQYKPLIGGTTSPHLNIRDIRKLIIPVFKKNIQTQIVLEIESRLSVADKMSETIQTSLQKAEALRQSILKRAFEGKLLSEAEVQACLKEADWEPAERLLERIKSEKMQK